MAGLRAHAVVSLWLLRTVVGLRMEVRGREKLPKPPYLVASKHQSAWDTFALIPIFTDPALVMKWELTLIPFYGWFSRKFEHVFVRRDRGPAALRQLVRDVQDRARAGREVLIFPEGTRRAPGAERVRRPVACHPRRLAEGRELRRACPSAPGTGLPDRRDRRRAGEGPRPGRGPVHGVRRSRNCGRRCHEHREKAFGYRRTERNGVEPQPDDQYSDGDGADPDDNLPERLASRTYSQAEAVFAQIIALPFLPLVFEGCDEAVAIFERSFERLALLV